MDAKLEQFWKAMCDELTAAHKLLAESDTPFNRRTLVRTSFAAIEGIVFFQKCYALARLRPETLGAAETAMLREESFALDGRGKVHVQQRFVPIDSNIRFAFSMYGRALGREIELDCSGAEWQAFKKALTARNRIVHPRTTDELRISDDELACTEVATRWIVGTMIIGAIDRLEELEDEKERMENKVRGAMGNDADAE